MQLDYPKISDFVRRGLLANELGGCTAVAYCFTDAQGKSGISFGLCQWDLNNNPKAATILRECGFSNLEIAALESKRLTNKTTLNAKLLDAREIVDKHDNREIGAIVGWVRDCCEDAGVVIGSEEAFVHLCDYHNQFHLDSNGKCIRHLAGLGVPVMAQHVLDYKKTTKWGRDRPDDVWRRWDNIHRLFA